MHKKTLVHGMTENPYTRATRDRLTTGHSHVTDAAATGTASASFNA